MKIFNKKIYGFSLVEILIAIGLAGGISLVIMSLMQNTKKAIETAETSNEIMQLRSKIENIMKSKESCTYTL